jgi:hypothetical protein
LKEKRTTAGKATFAWSVNEGKGFKKMEHELESKGERIVSKLDVDEDLATYKPS